MSQSNLNKILSKTITNDDQLEKVAAELDILANLVIDFYLQEKYHKEKDKKGEYD